MKRIFVTSVLVSFFVTLPAIAQAPQPKVVTDMVARAKAQLTIIDMKAFKQVLDREKKPAVIDVREHNEFAAGHVPGAISLPRGVIEFNIWPYVGYPEKTDMNKRFYLYCKTGSRVALAAKSLQDLGFTNLVVVDMQFADWEAAGYPVTEPEFPD
ncbi:MAG: rhodanese-like domain-containing protein [Acidiferrobacterales bacterium]